MVMSALRTEQKPGMRLSQAQTHMAELMELVENKGPAGS